MGGNKSVQKRIRQAKKANLRNKHFKSMVRTAVKKVFNADTKDEALPLMQNAISLIDRVAGKGIIHRNKAGNQKSQIMKYVNNLS